MEVMKKRMIMKKHILTGVLLSLILILTYSISISTTKAQASKKIKLSSNGIELSVGKKKTIYVKNLSKKKRTKWQVAAGKKYITLSKKKKNCVTIKAKKPGIAIVVAKIGKKKYRCTVYVRDEKNPASTTEPTYAPEGSATKTPVTSTTPTPEGSVTKAPVTSTTPIPEGSATNIPMTSATPEEDITTFPTHIPDAGTKRIYQYLDLDNNWSEITIPENIEEGAEIYYMESNVFEDAKGRSFRLDYLPETTVEAYIYAYEVEQIEAGGVTFTFNKDSDIRNDNSNTKDNETEYIEHITLTILDENQLEHFEKDELTIKTSYDTYTAYPDYEYDAEGNRYEYGEFAYYPNYKDSAIETSYDVQSGSLGEGSYTKPVKYHRINIVLRKKGEHWIEVYYKGDLVKRREYSLKYQQQSPLRLYVKKLEDALWTEEMTEAQKVEAIGVACSKLPYQLGYDCWVCSTIAMVAAHDLELDAYIQSLQYPEKRSYVGAASSDHNYLVVNYSDGTSSDLNFQGQTISSDYMYLYDYFEETLFTSEMTQREKLDAVAAKISDMSYSQVKEADSNIQGNSFSGVTMMIYTAGCIGVDGYTYIIDSENNFTCMLSDETEYYVSESEVAFKDARVRRELCEKVSGALFTENMSVDEKLQAMTECFHAEITQEAFMEIFEITQEDMSYVTYYNIIEDLFYEIGCSNYMIVTMDETISYYLYFDEQERKEIELYWF